MLILLTLVCSFTDLKWHRIPNWATYSAALWAIVLSLLTSHVFSPTGSVNGLARSDSGQMVVGSASDRSTVELPWEVKANARSVTDVDVRESVVGLLVCFAVMVVICSFARYGAGDIKLAAAIGALVGWEPGLAVLIVAHVAAATAVIVWLVWSMGPITCLSAAIRWIGCRLFPTLVLPVTADFRAKMNYSFPMAPCFAIGSAYALIAGQIAW
jgi:Flp pilus assembly protein protease CpaA